MKEKLQELLQDKDFVLAALDAESVEAVQKLFADKGVTVTAEQVGEMAEVFSKAVSMAQNADGELSEEELKEAAGGCFIYNGDLITPDMFVIPDLILPDGKPSPFISPIPNTPINPIFFQNPDTVGPAVDSPASQRW